MEKGKPIPARQLVRLSLLNQPHHSSPLARSGSRNRRVVLPDIVKSVGKQRKQGMIAVVNRPSQLHHLWRERPRGQRFERIADDLTRKSRTQIKPVEVVKTALPALGLAAAKAPVDAGTDAGTDDARKGKGCGCRTAGAERRSGAFAAFALALAVFGLRRQRRASSVGASTPRTPRAAK